MNLDALMSQLSPRFHHEQDNINALHFSTSIRAVVVQWDPTRFLPTSVSSTVSLYTTAVLRQ